MLEKHLFLFNTSRQVFSLKFAKFLRTSFLTEQNITIAAPPKNETKKIGSLTTDKISEENIVILFFLGKYNNRFCFKQVCFLLSYCSLK